MANWTKCTRKADNTPIYLNLDTALCLRWNEADNFTVVTLPGGKDFLIRVLEHPDDLLKGSAGQKRASKDSTRQRARGRS